jgi:hypothetical protein
MFAPLALIMLIAGGVSTAYVTTEENRVAAVADTRQSILPVNELQIDAASSPRLSAK